MNMIYFKGAFISQNGLKRAGQIIVEIEGLLVDGPKLYPGKQKTDPGILSPIKVEGSHYH